MVDIQFLDEPLRFHIWVKVERPGPTVKYICHLPLSLHPSRFKDVVEGHLDGGMSVVERSAGKSCHRCDRISILVNLKLAIFVPNPVPFEGCNAGAGEAQVLGEDFGEGSVVEETDSVRRGEEELRGKIVRIKKKKSTPGG